MDYLMWHLDAPQSLGSGRPALKASTDTGGVTDLTVPAGARRVVITIPAGVGNTIRVRGGISGSASITSDITTLVAPTSAYMDTIIAGDDTQTVKVDLRFTASISWIRVYNAGSAFNPWIIYYSGTSAPDGNVRG
jgi:hypothetical protein